MHNSIEHTLPSARHERALLMLRRALEGYASVGTTEDPGTLELRPGPMAGRGAVITRFRLQSPTPIPTPILAHETPHTASDIRIVVGQRLSVTRAAIREGRAQGIVGCIDLAGIVTVRLPGLYIDRSDLKPRPASEAGTASVGTMTDPFADRSSLVCRKLLSRDAPDTGWHTRELARVTGLAVSHVSAILNELVSRGICRREDTGTRKALITNRHALFTAWTEAYRWTNNTALTVAAPIGDADRFVEKLGRLFPSRLDWALTLTAGAARVAPHAPVETIHCYVSPSADERRAQRSPLAMLKSIAAECNWPVSGDGRLVLLAPHYRTSVWYEMQASHGVNVVSDCQLALDCWFYPNRGREQAEHLLHARRMLTGWE
jgi:hypothetical protein